MVRSHKSNGGAYAILDQQVYRLPGDDAEKGVGVFVRAIGAPADRNLVDLYVDAGFSALGLVPGRPDDFFGIAGAFARISPAARAADADSNAASGRNAPLRNFEAIIELSYSARIVPGIAVQPTFQYVFIREVGSPIQQATAFSRFATRRCSASRPASGFDVEKRVRSSTRPSPARRPSSTVNEAVDPRAAEIHNPIV